MLNPLPCFYYPTKVVIIDDNEHFINELPNNLSSHYLYESFINPNKALNIINSYQNNFLKPEYFLGQYEDILTDTSINVDIHKIGELIYKKDKYETPLTVIVDQDMPGMTGIELCEKIKNYPFKVIMLTGVAKAYQAVDAFNRGIIDKFIFKNQENVISQLNEAINEINMKHFNTISEYIVKNISNTFTPFFNNNNVKKLWSKILIEKNSVEYFLLDLDGSLLMLTEKGELLWLIVQSLTKVETIIQIAKASDADDSIIKDLESKRKICGFFSESDFNKPIQDWNNLLVNANCENDVYYSLIEGDEVYQLTGLNKNNISCLRK